MICRDDHTNTVLSHSNISRLRITDDVSTKLSILHINIHSLLTQQLLPLISSPHNSNQPSANRSTRHSTRSSGSRHRRNPYTDLHIRNQPLKTVSFSREGRIPGIQICHGDAVEVDDVVAVIVTIIIILVSS